MKHYLKTITTQVCHSTVVDKHTSKLKNYKLWSFPLSHLPSGLLFNVFFLDLFIVFFIHVFPQERLKELEQEVSGGATAIVALIINNKLYIANVGMNT